LFIPILKKNLKAQKQNINFRINSIKYFRYLIIILILVSLILPFGTFINKCGAQAIDKDVAWVYGTVTDIAMGGPAVNFTVEIKGPIFKGNSTTTDQNGYYSLFVASGELTITVYFGSGIYHPPFDFTIESGKSKQIDLEIDSRRGLHKIYGYIFDADLEIAAIGYKVNATIENIEYETTVTDHLGHYELILYPGTYKFCISMDNVVYCDEEITIQNEDLLYNKTIKEKKKKEKVTLPWIDVNQVVKDIVKHWYFFILLIVVCIIIPIILTFYDRLFDKVLAKKYKFLDEKSLLFIENVIRYNIYIAFIILVLWLLSLIFPGFNDSVWKYIAPHIPAIYTIILLFILMRLFLLILRRIMDYLRGNLSTKPKIQISPRYIGFFEIILKYLIIFIFSISIIVIALAIFGMGDVISKSFSDFFATNSGYLVFIVLIIIMMYFAGRFLRSFIDDMKRRETARFSPQIADMAGKVIKIVIYVFGIMIIIFALLNMAGMGSLGQTLILIISIIIGFVVSMAATGSIGNILTSFVLNAFQPFAVGDRVKIGEVIGDVESTNLAFVRIRTLNNEIVDISNNNVIADKIFNFSKSGAFAVNVDVGIGYTVPAEHVKKFLIEATRETKDIEDDPRPFVIITNMGDYAVTYKLRAYTTNAKAMFKVRSNLMANVQKEFYSHGVEILSPWYLVRRDEKMPTGEEVMDTWDTTDKKTEEAISKETEESITDGFGLMDKTMTEEKQM